MMRRLAVIVFLLFVSISVFSQGKDNSLKGVPFKERIVTGGGFGLGFGNTQDYVSVSPVIGYQLTTKLMAGTSVTYRYTNFKFVKPSINLNDYGVNPFVRFMIHQGIFLQTEYEYLNYEFPVNPYPETTRETFTSFLGGGGFIQPLSEKVGLYFMALYNFSYEDPKPNQYAVYGSPLIIRAGINIGNFGF
jgi:hypothetical protein